MDNTELRHHCYAMGYSDGEVGAFYDGYEKGKADAIDEYVKLFIENALIDESKTWTEYARKVAEQLKEQTQ